MAEGQAPSKELPESVRRALKQIAEHPHVKSIEPQNAGGADTDTSHEVIIYIETNLPVAWRASGVSPETGVRLLEAVRFVFPATFPTNPPRIYLRQDFNRSLPHIQPGNPEGPVEPCYLDGDPRDEDGAKGTSGRGRPITIDWATVEDVLARYDAGTAVNVAQLVGNTALRIAALGWDDRPTTPAATRDQRARLREAMEQGAFGVSSGLDYPPGAYATTRELADLANEAAKLGGIYHTHVRYALGDRFLDPFREAIEIGRLGDAPAHITHFYHRATFPGTPDQMLDLVDEAASRGQDVSFDLYPSEWASTRLLILIPTWVLEGGPQRTKERLADPTVRDRIRDDLRARGQLFAGSGGIRDVRIGYLRRPENLRWEGRTLGELIDDSGRDAVDALCDLLLAEDLRPNEVTPGPNLEGTRRFLRHPGAMIGTDSVFVGAKPSPRTYGSFPRILGQFVRDEALLGLEEAIHRMTGLPAARLGLRERGVIRDGAVADLAILDPATVRSDATIDDPTREPEGIEHVIVAGELVIDGGRPTGARPGRGLRRGRD